MNLADYLSELLGQQDEVNLPGLGYFVRERVAGHYDEKEGKFYPPYHKVKFVPESKDDDTFAQYVATKKNISLASSKYFAEKFISKLKEDAAKGKYLFSDLGLFYTDLDQLVFKPNDKIASDPAFYGYQPVSINKVGQEQLPVEQANPAFAKPTPSQELPASPIKTLRQLQQEQYIEEEYEERKSVSIWWTLLITLSVIVLALFGVYKFYPAAFDKLKASFHKTFTKEGAIVPTVRHAAKPDTLSPDTVIKAAPGADTASKPIAPAGSGKGIVATDTVNVSRFELVVASFKATPSATRELERYKAKGLNAKILTDAPGPLVKISVGTYPSWDVAETAKSAYIKLGKIPNGSNILEIKPHK